MEHRERCKNKNWVLIVATICALVFSATCKPATSAKGGQSVKRPANCLCISREDATVPLEAQDPYPTADVGEGLNGNTKEQDNYGGLIDVRISDDDPGCPPCPPGQKPQKKAVDFGNDGTLYVSDPSPTKNVSKPTPSGGNPLSTDGAAGHRKPVDVVCDHCDQKTDKPIPDQNVLHVINHTVPTVPVVPGANDQYPVEGSSEVNGEEHNCTNPEHHGHHHHHGGWHHMPHHHGHQHDHHWPHHHGHHGPPPFNYHPHHLGGGRHHHGPPGHYHQGPPGHYNHGFNPSADPNLLLQPPGQAPPQGGHMNHHGFGGPHPPSPGPGGPPLCTYPAQEGCQFRQYHGYIRRHHHNG